MENRLKKTSLRKGIIIIFFLLTIGIVSHIVYVKDQIMIVRQYYDSLINKDYEKAFDYLFLWDDYINNPTKLSEKEAREIYVSRLNSISQDIGYQVISAKFDRYREDGFTYYNTVVQIKIGDEINEITEHVRFIGRRIYIEGGQDKYVFYRQGKFKDWDI